MLIIISAAALALAFALIVLLLQTQKTHTARVEETHGAMLMVGVQIICGDCSGDEESPVRTYVDNYGNCTQCGGHSYQLAASVALNSAALRAARLVQANSAAAGSRVLPFETRARASRAQRIAV